MFWCLERRSAGVCFSLWPQKRASKNDGGRLSRWGRKNHQERLRLLYRSISRRPTTWTTFTISWRCSRACWTTPANVLLELAVSGGREKSGTGCGASHSSLRVGRSLSMPNKAPRIRPPAMLWSTTSSQSSRPLHSSAAAMLTEWSPSCEIRFFDVPNVAQRISGQWQWLGQRVA